MVTQSTLKIKISNWFNNVYWWIRVGFNGITWPITTLYHYLKSKQETKMAKQLNPTGKKSASHGTHRAKRHPTSPKNKK